MARSSLLVMVLAAVALTGCSTKLGGRPVAGDPPPSTAQPSPAEVLGELTTIEPCSLTAPDLFSQFGTAAYAVPESLDYCAISVKPNSTTEAVVMVGQLGRFSDSPEMQGQRLETIDDDLYTVQPTDEEGFCSQQLVFEEDDLTLEVSTYMLSGTTDTCPMVDAAMDRVVEVVEDEAVGHRSPGSNSLVGLDPCDLVADQTVAALPGFAAAEREDNPGRHTCYWETSPGEDRLSVRVTFAAGPVPAVAGDADATANPIAGRATVTNPFPEVGQGAYCSVETGHIPFTEVEGQTGVVELASVFVRVPLGQVQAGCQAAVAVATELWPQLPAV